MVGASGDSNMGVARTRTNKGILNWWGLEPIRDYSYSQVTRVEKHLVKCQ